MTRGKMEFADINSDSHTSLTPGHDRGGCRVSMAMGFVLALLAIAIAVGVGLIVHFAGGSKTVNCHFPKSGANDGSSGQQGGGKMSTIIPKTPEINTEKTDITSTPLTTKTVTATLTTKKTSMVDYKCIDRCKNKCSTPSTTTKPSTKPTDVRLPGTIAPTSYNVFLKPMLYDGPKDDFKFIGKVTITILCKIATEKITVHVKSLNLTSTPVLKKSDGSAAPSVDGKETDKEREFLIVKLGSSLVVGVSYDLTLEFEGPLKDDLAGLYLSQYQDINGTDRYIATSQMQPTDARKTFPCFDEPALKANFTISIARKPHMISLANMPLTRTDPVSPDGYVVDHFKETVKMPTYLLAFIVCDFDYKEMNTTKGTKFRVYARKEAIEQVKYALDAGVKILEHFETYFAIDYPLPKQDMIAIPDFAAGAMENWGLITYRETALLYDPKVSSASNKQRVAVVIAHELAHQWFGNLVSPVWWDDLWLNEGFASYVEYIGTNFYDPKMHMMEQFIEVDLQDTFAYDQLATSHPIYVPVNNPDEINEIFDRISYGKGASIIRMMNYVLSEKVFTSGLTKYLNKYAYGNANHTNLWDALFDEAKKNGITDNVPEIMDTWTLQMGFPVVTINRTKYSNKEAAVTQKYFRIDPTQNITSKYSSPFGYKWEVPFTYTTSQDLNWTASVRWMHKGDITLTEKEIGHLTNDDWIIGNLQQYGYYRVNYDTNNWKSILRQLREDHSVIHVSNRAQLMDDAFNLARAGEIDSTIAMDTTVYLDKESDYIPWASATSNLDYIDIMLSKGQHYGDFEHYMKAKVTPLYQKVGWKDDPSEADVFDHYLRAKALGKACSYGMDSCHTEAAKLFKSWMESSDPDTNNQISPNLRSIVYCNGIKSGGVREWDFAYTRFKKANVAVEKVKLLYALSCTKEPWLLNRYLQRSITPSEIRKQDATSAMQYVSRNPIGRSIAWEFLRSKWTFLKEEYGKGFFSFTRLVKTITESFNTRFELEQLESFIADHPNQGTATRAFQQAVESTNANIRWMNMNEHVIGQWLKEKNKCSGTGCPSTTKPKLPTDIRIHKALYPVYYNVRLRPDMYAPKDPENFTFDGSVAITLYVKNSTNNITLHINKLTLDNDSISLTSDDGQQAPNIVNNYDIDKSRQFLIFNLDSDLIQGKNYTLKMNFSGKLTDDLAGLYYSKYTNGENKTVYIATTQLEAPDARRTFPCYDEPELKSVFEVTLLRKNHMVSLSNMPQTRNETLEDGWVADYYKPTVKMSTYLLAFIICDFIYKENTTNRGTVVRVWARKEAIGQADYALQAGVRINEYYEKYFNIPYPLPKQDMIAIPDFAAGAMENWGLITYRETALLYDPKVSSAGNKQRVAVVVAHELAHQWFGNLVSPAWWDDLWLNEGFASYVEYIGVDHIEPEMKMLDQFVTKDLESTFKYDHLTNSHPVILPVNRPEEVNEIFDTITYGKGASIIRMMQNFLGENTFSKGLTNYLNEIAYDVATHDDLWKNLNEQAVKDSNALPASLKTIMDTWTLQMGFPVVFINTSNPVLTARQSYFRINPSEPISTKYKSDYGYKWYIPLTYTTGSVRNFNSSKFIWMHLNDTTLNGATLQPNEWLIGNVGQYGYYRVNYDENNWRKIILQLQTDHTAIHPRNRAQLLDDSFQLSSAGHIPITIALDMTKYLANETEYVPWSAAVRSIGYVAAMIYKTEYYGDYQKYMLGRIMNLYNTLGWNDTENDPFLDHYKRVIVVSRACAYGNQSCLDTALEQFKQWKNNPSNNKISPNMKTTVYCNAIKNGGIDEWNFAFDQYKKANVASEKAKLLSSLSCSKQVWILNRFLRLSVQPDQIRKQDAVSVITGVAASSIGQPLAWDFIRANYKYIRGRFGEGSFSFASLASGVVSSFASEFELEQLNAFIDANPDLGTARRAFSQAIEKTKTNIKWLKENGEIVGQWFRKNKDM